MKHITFDHILASFIFFTRLPFWRLRQPPKENYAAVVEYWPQTVAAHAAYIRGEVALYAAIFICVVTVSFYHKNSGTLELLIYSSTLSPSSAWNQRILSSRLNHVICFLAYTLVLR